MNDLGLLQQVLDGIPDPVLVKDADQRWVFMNSAMCQFMGRTASELIGKTDADLLGSEMAAQILAVDREVLESGEERVLEEDYEYPAGQLLILRTRKRRALLDTPQGPRPYVVGTFVDVTEVRRLQRDLAAVLESTTDSVFVIDKDWRISFMNENARRDLGEHAPRVGQTLWDAFPTAADGPFGRYYHKAMQERVSVQFEELVPETNRWVGVHVYPTTDGGLSVFVHDVTDRRLAEQERLHAQEQISYMARHDGLTGLPNRQQFSERLERTLQECEGGRCAAIHFLDLDGFKAVNDTMGHAAGDVLLQRVGERIQNSVRGSDVVARFGGDEFAVLQNGVKRPEAAAELAQRFVDVLSDPFEIDGHTALIGVSVGIAMAPEHGKSSESLLGAADTALYVAKAEGRGVYRFFETGMDLVVREKHATRAALRLALARHEFELHYQPLIDLRTQKLSSFEALLRWRHPKRGLIQPDDFIPFAEESRLIIPIGEWVLREACAEAVKWPEEIGLAVNLSPVQFKKSGLVEMVSRTLEETGLRAERLQLEITESVLLEHDSGNLATLQNLRRLGVQIAMDDFGTGYSSLSYLRSFPFDKIKLDRSFIQDLHLGGEARAIVHAMASLGAGLGITMAAEGIETLDQLAAVQREGYSEGQGFLFSKPVAAEEIPSVILRQTGQALRRKSGMAFAPAAQETGADPAPAPRRKASR